MSDNPLMAAPDEPRAALWTLDGMLDWCAAENQRECWKEADRWFYVIPAEEAENRRPRIAFLEGLKAQHARMAAEGKPFQRFDPEPGEAEWITRAVGEYIKRGGRPEGFKATMDRWSAAKPWRQIAA